MCLTKFQYSKNAIAIKTSCGGVKGGYNVKSERKRTQNSPCAVRISNFIRLRSSWNAWKHSHPPPPYFFLFAIEPLSILFAFLFALYFSTHSHLFYFPLVRVLGVGYGKFIYLNWWYFRTPISITIGIFFLHSWFLFEKIILRGWIS